MLRLPVRRLSFFSLIVGAIFGCCLNSLVHESLQQLFFSDSLIPITEVDQETDSPFQQEITVAYTENAGAQINEKQHVEENNDKGLYNKVRVLCWVMTSPENHETKALAVKETWGKRCNVLLFMSSEADAKLPTVQLNVKEGRNGLWRKTREAFRYAWDRYQDEVDWFFKADDDTYVVVENMRYFLSAFNTSNPFWFGHKFKTNVTSGFFSGGAGYALSKEATRRFVKDGYFNPLLCRNDHEGTEDVEMGRCMENLNVSTMDTRDSKGRGRFFPFQPDRFYFSRKVTDYWYWKFIYYPPIMGPDCCSDSTISFHYIDPKTMRLLDFFFYQIRPFGIVDQRPATPEPPPDLNLTANPWFAPHETSVVVGIPITTTTKNEVDISFGDNPVGQQTIKQSSGYSRYQIHYPRMLDQPPAMSKLDETITHLLTISPMNMTTTISSITVDHVTVKTNATRLATDGNIAIFPVKKSADELSRQRNYRRIITIRNRPTTEPVKEILDTVETILSSENTGKQASFTGKKKKYYRKKFIDFEDLYLKEKKKIVDL